MSSPHSVGDHKHISTETPEATSGTPRADDHQRSTVTSPTEPRDGPAPPVPSSPANFAFDETVFGTAPLTASPGIDDDEHAPDDEIPYPEAEEGSILPPPDFKPFFTLIEDSTTGEHQHPTVHYLFADDDQEILTAAALETVSHERQEPDDERFVIVDMNADGREVVGISSLSPDWQTLKTKVTQAPSWGDASKSAEKGLMLRISGKEAEAGGDKGRKGDVDGLLKAFDELAGTLDEVLGSSITELDNQIVQ